MKKTIVAAMSAGFIAVSMLPGVSPVAGANPCTNWQLHGPSTIAHSDGVTVKIAQWDGAYVHDDKAQLFLADGTPAWLDAGGYPIGHYKYTPGNNAPLDAPSVETGRNFGGVKGNNFDMSIIWDGGKAGSNRYLGTVDQNGYASGTDVNSQNHIQTNWNMVEHFTCAP